MSYKVSDIESTDTDESYHIEDDVDGLESEDYSVLGSDLYESDEETFVFLSGGWRVVNVFKDVQPHG